MTPGHFVSGSTAPPIPTLVGIGLRSEHEQLVLDELPNIGWLEVHSENYFGMGGRPATMLERIRQHYPISLHGIGMGLGNTDAIDRVHIRRLKDLIDAIDPVQVSEHLCWNAHQNHHFSDLLPLPHIHEAVAHTAARIDEVQQSLGRKVLIENISTYIQFKTAELSEQEFLLEVANRSGCGLLLDVNNVYVNAHNHQFDALEYLNVIPGHMVGEIHVAGHTRRPVNGRELLLDTHDQPVCEEVWQLYERLVDRIGPRPTLLEYDANLPLLKTLLEEARVAERLLQNCTSSEVPL